MSLLKYHEDLSLDSLQDRLFWYDDFEGDQLKDEWATNSSGAGGSIVIVDAQTGAIVRITSGNLNGNTGGMNWNNIRSLHVNQKAAMECQVALSRTTNCEVWLFLRFDATTLIGFEYEDAWASWRVTSINGAMTQGSSGIAGDLIYHIFRVQSHTHGSNHIHFYIDDIQTTNSPITTNIPDDAADFLCPFFRTKTREDSSNIFDINYVALRQER